MAVAPTGPAAAHTESDLVAVPAGAEATVTLEPTHGCAGSPTVAVRIRAPFPDAVAEDVEGWTATATPDGAGNTVLEWTGGLLPADEDGAFPVEFVAPDAVGALLTFPAVQECADGSELAWISGDPADEFPAPRVLVLAAGSPAAATIDDVPLDAPGRDQLVAVVDVDNPRATPSTASPPSTAVTPPVAITPAPAPTVAPATASTPTTVAATTPAPTTTPTTSVAAAPTPTTVTADDAGRANTAAKVITALVLVAAVVMAAAAVLVRRRDRRRARDAGP
jgi:uncharacterized protein YcnI